MCNLNQTRLSVQGGWLSPVGTL